MNTCNFTGRLTKDPELSSTSGGNKYSRFTLAVSRGKVKEGQQQADFIPCVAWNKTAEILVNYCKKGSMIGVNGRFAAQQYERDGEKRTGYEIIALSLEMLGGKPESKPQEDTKAKAPTPPQEPIEATIDDYIDDNVNLPFEI